MWRLVLAVAVAQLCKSQMSCKNEDNLPVDWYIIYKLPAHTGSGDAYYYIDGKEEGMNKKSVDHQEGVLANTLKPYFDKAADTAYIAYSDQPPTCSASDSYGHSKGFVMMDKTSGFWLSHSTPKFPFGRESNNFFPQSGKENGQTFICVTFPYATFKQIGLHLQYIHAHIFEHNIPDGFYDDLKKAANLKDGTKLKEAVVRPNQLYQALTANDKQVQFRSFFKKVTESKAKDCSENYKKEADEAAKEGDLYAHIAENIGSTVYAQTWNQGGKCVDYTPQSGFNVHNVECIEVDGKRWITKDHSKWCVSEVNDWTCFGDSNRALSQYKRLGGALCIKDNRVNKQFMEFKKDKTDCTLQKRPASAAGKNIPQKGPKKTG